MRIKKFDIKLITSDSLIVMLGKRKRGKSVLVKDIMYHRKNIPMGIVITSEADDNHGNDLEFYKEFVPNSLIHEGYKSGIVEQLIECQKSRYPYDMDYRLIEGKDESIDRRVFCIIEDEVPEKEFSNGNLLKLSKYTKRWQILTIIALQHLIKMPPSFRLNIDFIFIFKDNDEKELIKIYDKFDIFPTFDMFMEGMELLGENECFVLHNNLFSNKYEVFWYKAELHEEFKVCREEIWKLNDVFE